MLTDTAKALDSLSKCVREYKDLEATSERHLFLLWLITRGMTALGAERPILVGGGAVELYTSVRFATGDLDIVAPDIDTCEMVLRALDFEQPANSGHHVNRDIAALVEIHGGVLFKGEEPIELVYRKVPLLIASPEDCIAERLASYRRHGSSLDLLNAFLISYHQRDRLDVEHLQARVSALDLWDHLSAIQCIGRNLVLNMSGTDEAAAELIHLMKDGPAPCAF
jgi:hypothetical protein